MVLGYLNQLLLLRTQVRLFQGCLSLNWRLDNLNKAPLLVYRQLSIRRNQGTYQCVEQAFAGPRLLTEASTSQVDPFQALATLQIFAFTFDDDDQEPPDNSSSQSSRSLAIIDESSKPIFDAALNVKEAPFEIVSTCLLKMQGIPRSGQ